MKSPEEEHQDTLNTLAKHRITLSRIEEAYRNEGIIKEQDLDWLFRITHANFKMIESGDRLITVLRVRKGELELAAMLKDQEIYELRNNDN